MNGLGHCPGRAALCLLFQAEDTHPFIGVIRDPVVDVVRVGAFGWYAKPVMQSFVVRRCKYLGADGVAIIHPAKDENVSAGKSGDQPVKRVCQELDEAKPHIQVSQGVVGQSLALTARQVSTAPDLETSPS